MDQNWYRKYFEESRLNPSQRIKLNPFTFAAREVYQPFKTNLKLFQIKKWFALLCFEGNNARMNKVYECNRGLGHSTSFLYLYFTNLQSRQNNSMVLQSKFGFCPLKVIRVFCCCYYSFKNQIILFFISPCLVLSTLYSQIVLRDGVTKI